jgi:AraC-like DNA-binding protein
MEPLHALQPLVLRHAGAGTKSPNPLGLLFHAARSMSEPIHRVYEPVFALVVQGEKRSVVGNQHFTCGKGQFVVVTVDLPVAIQTSAASIEQPYLSLAMTLKPAHVATLLLETAAVEGLPLAAAGMGVSDAPTELLEAVLRLVRLLDHPRDLPVLGPLVERELLWRLLCSKQGHRLRQIGLADSRLSQIGRAIRWIREHYNDAMRIEELARLAAMSVTSFHRQFRAVTLMSPLQYLKQIRLQEARSRLLAGAEDVARVGHAVGYDNPSQFSREYKRAFGSPPGEDARLLRASHGAASLVRH